MLAHYHGQVWNDAELARAMGVSESTARRYLDLLCGGIIFLSTASFLFGEYLITYLLLKL